LHGRHELRLLQQWAEDNIEGGLAAQQAYDHAGKTPPQPAAGKIE
jgi:hypothetical protein